MSGEPRKMCANSSIKIVFAQVAHGLQWFPWLYSHISNRKIYLAKEWYISHKEVASKAPRDEVLLVKIGQETHLASV